MTTQAQQALPDPEFLDRVAEFAVEAAWSYIDSNSYDETIEGVEWLNLSHSTDSPELEIDMLRTLGLLERHPERPELVRKVAEL